MKSLNKKRYISANSRLFLYFGTLALLGSLVLEFPVLYKNGTSIAYIDALFTAVSALCVTGLSTIDITLFNTKGLLVLMMIIEAGGLGLITFFSLYLARPGAKISQINRRFVRDFFLSDVEINPRKIVTRILSYTLGIQLSCALILMLLLYLDGRSNFIFYGLFLSVSAFCNAGFSPYSDSLISFNKNIPFCVVISFLIISGGIGFTVMQEIVKRINSKIHHKKRSKLSLHTRIVIFMTAILIIIPAPAIFVLEYDNAFSQMNLLEKINNAFFQSITTRTAGFEAVSQSSFAHASAFISCVIMIIGGSPGSMAGGIKTTTIFLLLCNTFRSEDDRNEMSILKRDISESVIAKASSITIKALLFLIFILFILFITEHDNLSSQIFHADDLLYETVSAIATVGLTRSVTPNLSLFGKIFIIITMFAGRTGIIAMSMKITTKMNNMNRFIDYPKENIIIG